MAVAAKPEKKLHYFVINQLGQSADRRGPFESAEAAHAWADEHYNYPSWVIPAEPTSRALKHRLLDKHGNPVEPKE